MGQPQYLSPLVVYHQRAVIPFLMRTYAPNILLLFANRIEGWEVKLF